MHRLGQFYLRRWADAAGGVNVLLRDGREITTGTSAVAVGNDFYAITEPDGTKDSRVEDKVLRIWDGRGADIVRKLVAGEFPLSDEDRMNFGLFMGLQWLRGRHAREVSQESHDLFHKLIITAGLDHQDSPDQVAEAQPQAPDDSLAVPSRGHLPDETKEILRDWDAYEFPLPQEQAIGQMVHATPDAASYFLDTNWLLLQFDGYPLLTSDEPLALCWDRDPAPLAPGLANSDVILFPVSPSDCLVMERSEHIGRECVLPGTASVAEEFNEIMVQNTWWEQLYRHPDGPAFPTPKPLPARRVIMG
jgi:hypothetical protein